MLKRNFTGLCVRRERGTLKISILEAAFEKVVVFKTVLVFKKVMLTRALQAAYLLAFAHD